MPYTRDIMTELGPNSGITMTPEIVREGFQKFKRHLDAELEFECKANCFDY